MKKRPSKSEKRFKKQLREQEKTLEEQDAKMIYWEKSRKKWYHVYLFAGVGINFLLYYTKPYGFDPSGSILWGSLFGLGIPLAAMFLFSYIHKRILGV